MELLIAHYFHLCLPSSNASKSENISDDILEQRSDEKASLESIYEKAFEERIPNRVWAAKLDLPYLLDRCKNTQHPNKLHQSDSRSHQSKLVKKDRSKELCNFVASGKPCRFGDKCKFSHKLPTTEECKATTPIEDYQFILEIRFPPGKSLTKFCVLKEDFLNCEKG